MPLRIAITGGGTGGHIIPALAIAKALQSDPDIAGVFYVGNRTGLEHQLVPPEGIEFHGISFYGMPRRSPFKLIRWYFDLKAATREAGDILKQLKPDIVAGTGGYVSAPVLMAAQKLGIPTMIHEPDAHPGLANRYLAKKARAITAAFESSRPRFGLSKNNPRFHATGNPIRAEFGRLSRAQAFKALGLDWETGRTTLLVFGGSQGAQRINMAVAEALPTLIYTLGFQVAHITGAKRYEETLAAVPSALKENPRYRVLPFSGQMPEWLAACDIALCRAGSMTLSELAASGKPAILVPYPHAAANHQYYNALSVVEAGAALLLADADCTAARVVELLQPLAGGSEELAGMARNAARLARPQATADIIACLKACAHQ